MKTILGVAALVLSLGTLSVQAAPARQDAAAPQSQAPAPPAAKSADQSSNADAYFYFTAGHIHEIEYEITGSAEQADEAVSSYKKALELDPGSAVIQERIAEVYAKSRRTRDAVAQAQEVLKIDPNNVDAHRLLARIYIRSLGDMNAGEVQQESLQKAVAEFQAILKLDPHDTYSALWLARLYRFQNKHDDAEKVLRGIVQREPDNEPALEQLSQLLIDEGRSQEAIELLSHTVDDSSSPDAYDLLGAAYAKTKDYANAEAAYRKAVADDPDDPGHRHGLAEALLAEEKYPEALEQYKKLVQLEPDTADNYLRIAELDRRLSNFDEAEANIARAKQLSPGSLEILYNEALLYEDEGRYDDAVKVLSDAIAGLKSQSADGMNANALAILYEQLGHAYVEQQNYTAAVDTFQDMAKLGPDQQKHARLLLIDVYRESREIDRAIEEAKKSLDASPKDPDVTVTLALLYGEKSETATARELLQGLLHGDSSDQAIYIDIAQVEERGKKYAEAEQAAQKAEELAQSPQDKQAAWYVLGAIYEREKKFDLAEQEFRKILEADPDNAAALNYLGYMFADRGIHLDEATSMIQSAVKQDPNNGAFLDSLGWVYYKQNKLTEAEQYMRKAVDREGHDPTILSHLGAVYLKLGENERAAQILERSLTEWQKVLPADYEADKANEVETQLRTLKRRLAQKTPSTETKPQ